MSQLTVHGADALDPDLFESPAPRVGPAIFERLPMTATAPFASPRLVLAVQQHHEGGRRQLPSPDSRPASYPVSRLASCPGSRPASRPAPGPVPLRLTRRGRLVGVIVLALIVTALSFALGLVPSSASTASPGTTASGESGRPGSSIVVQPGDTLWSIATSVAPDADPRATVQKIIDLNRLANTAIWAGEMLVLPS